MTRTTITADTRMQNAALAYTQTLGGTIPTGWQKGAERLQATLARMRNTPTPEEHSVLWLPERSDDLEPILTIANDLRRRFRHVVVLGAGGSGLSGQTLAMFKNPVWDAKGEQPKLYFLDNIDPHTVQSLLAAVDLKHTGFIAISKSGATVETLCQMMVMREALAKASPNPDAHFTIITVEGDSPLCQLAKQHGMSLLPHDPYLGGRFSIFSAVGLLPAALAGLNIASLRRGANTVIEHSFQNGATSEPARGAALQAALMQAGKQVHVFMPYCDRMSGLAMWFRQSWAESLGKKGLGATPVRGRGATDQHSQLQLYLDGPKDKYFTFLSLEDETGGPTVSIPPEFESRLYFLRDKTLGSILRAEMRGTMETLQRAGACVRHFTLLGLDEAAFGALLMHFTLEILLIADLLGINAFDQPAVEASKRLTREYLLKEMP